MLGERAGEPCGLSGAGKAWRLLASDAIHHKLIRIILEPAAASDGNTNGNERCETRMRTWSGSVWPIVGLVGCSGAEIASFEEAH